jgi:PII-like signaling protein
VKKSQLATPAGIDHDFNFLTSIERSLEKAERDVNSKTLGAALSNLQVERKKGLIGDKGYEAAGVTVIRAPKGLSRQRENATHRNNRLVSGLAVYVLVADDPREGRTLFGRLSGSIQTSPALLPVHLSEQRSFKHMRTSQVHRQARKGSARVLISL